MSTKLLIKKFIILTIIFLFFLTFFVNDSYGRILEPSGTADMGLQEVTFRGKAGFSSTQSIGGIIAAIIKGFLGLLGVIFIILILLAGFNWMTAAGEEEKVKKAKDTLQRAVIGLLIIVSAYAITYFVFKYMPWGGGSGMGSQQ